MGKNINIRAADIFIRNLYYCSDIGEDMHDVLFLKGEHIVKCFFIYLIRESSMDVL